MAAHDLKWEDRQAIADTFLDLLYDDIEEHFERGEFAKVDTFLQCVVVEDTEHVMLLGVLSATVLGANLLPSYPIFYHRVYDEIRRTKSEHETNELLSGLQWIQT